MRKIILRGTFYDLFIEPFLKRTKEWIARFIIQHDLFPALEKHYIALANSSIVVAQFEGLYRK